LILRDRTKVEFGVDWMRVRRVVVFNIVLQNEHTPLKT
jgi:hypothetical protein